MKQLGIYIHLPFCTKKCGYCDFYSVSTDEEMKKKYIKALVKEIEGEDPEQYEDYAIHTLYFGGGTPSILQADALKQVIDTVRRTFLTEENRKISEVTVECNPATVTKEKLQSYLSMGINRLSIGLQSTHNEELKLLGRIHTFENFLESYQLAREVGFRNVNVDLMSGLPKQTIKNYEISLQRLIALNPEHIASYSLILEEGTPFFKKYAEGSKMAKLLPDEETEREMYYLTSSMLKSGGYERYEISNYAKRGFHSIHNSSYWKRIPYLGFGAAAASQFGKKRWKNISNLRSYIQKINCGENITEEEVILTRENEMEEMMFLGLRMAKGISKKEFLNIFGIEIEEIYGSVIRKYLNYEGLEEKEGCLRLTEKGIDLSNQILSDFLLP